MIAVSLRWRQLQLPTYVKKGVKQQQGLRWSKGRPFVVQFLIFSESLKDADRRHYNDTTICSFLLVVTNLETDDFIRLYII